NPNDTSYKNYGGRNIKVCKQWENIYIVFKIWAEIHGYRKNLTIDRIDNDGNYEPSNCKWSTKKEQNRNQTKTKLTMDKAIKIRKLYNEKIFTKEQLSITYKVSHRTIYSILNNRGWIE
ncbi:unnamed protein product, partial [marine sediment metagenome]